MLLVFPLAKLIFTNRLSLCVLTAASLYLERLYPPSNLFSSSSDKPSVILLLSEMHLFLVRLLFSKRKKENWLEIRKWLFRPICFEVCTEGERSIKLRKLAEKSNENKIKSQTDVLRFLLVSSEYLKARSQTEAWD